MSSRSKLRDRPGPPVRSVTVQMTPRIARQVREDIEEAERDIGHALDHEATENIVFENVRVALEGLAERVRGLNHHDPFAEALPPYDVSRAVVSRKAVLALLSAKEEGS